MEFWGHWSLTLNVRLVVIVDFSPIIWLWKYYCDGTMLQGLEFCGALVGGHDFGFTVTEECLILTDWYAIGPPERQMRKPDRERAKFEQFKRSDFFDWTTKLPTLVGVAEGCELVAFWKGRHCRFYVGLLIVMVWKVIECLNTWRWIGVEIYAILIDNWSKRRRY